jgi:hypothetical protein
VIRVFGRRGSEGALLIWNCCHACRRGLIAQIRVIDPWKRQGLGRILVGRALRDGPGYTWTTTGQSSEAQFFFPVIAGETGAALTVGPGCRHIAEPSVSTSTLESSYRFPGSVLTAGEISGHAARRDGGSVAMSRRSG